MGSSVHAAQAATKHPRLSNSVGPSLRFLNVRVRYGVHPLSAISTSSTPSTAIPTQRSRISEKVSPGISALSVRRGALRIAIGPLISGSSPTILYSYLEGPTCSRSTPHRIKFMDMLQFVIKNYKNFNARVTRDATVAYWRHIESGGKMFWAVAGAMSSAQLGITLAPAIRSGLIHGMSVTGANSYRPSTTICMRETRRNAGSSPRLVLGSRWSYPATRIRRSETSSHLMSRSANATRASQNRGLNTWPNSTIAIASCLRARELGSSRSEEELPGVFLSALSPPSSMTSNSP